MVRVVRVALTACFRLSGHCSAAGWIGCPGLAVKCIRVLLRTPRFLQQCTKDIAVCVCVFFYLLIFSYKRQQRSAWV